MFFHFPFYCRILIEIFTFLFIISLSEVAENAGSVKEGFSYAYAWFIVILCFALIGFIIGYYLMNRKFKDFGAKGKFIEFYDGLRPGAASKLYHAIFLTRRIVLGMIIVLLRPAPLSTTLTLFILVQFLVLMYVSMARPFICLRDNIVEIFNETMYIILLLILTTLPEADDWNDSLIAFVVSVIFINCILTTLLLLVLTGKDIYYNKKQYNQEEENPAIQPEEAEANPSLQPEETLGDALATQRGLNQQTQEDALPPIHSLDKTQILKNFNSNPKDSSLMTSTKAMNNTQGNMTYQMEASKHEEEKHKQFDTNEEDHAQYDTCEGFNMSSKLPPIKELRSADTLGNKALELGARKGSKGTIESDDGDSKVNMNINNDFSKFKQGTKFSEHQHSQHSKQSEKNHSKFKSEPKSIASNSDNDKNEIFDNDVHNFRLSEYERNQSIYQLPKLQNPQDFDRELERLRKLIKEKEQELKREKDLERIRQLEKELEQLTSMLTELATLQKLQDNRYPSQKEEYTGGEANSKSGLNEQMDQMQTEMDRLRKINIERLKQRLLEMQQELQEARELTGLKNLELERYTMQQTEEDQEEMLERERQRLKELEEERKTDLDLQTRIQQLKSQIEQERQRLKELDRQRDMINEAKLQKERERQQQLQKERELERQLYKEREKKREKERQRLRDLEKDFNRNKAYDKESTANKKKVHKVKHPTDDLRRFGHQKTQKVNNFYAKKNTEEEKKLSRPSTNEGIMLESMPDKSF